MGFPIVEIQLPELGGDFSAFLQRWLVPIGVLVSRDEPIARITVNGQPHQVSCNMDVVIEERLAAVGEALAANQLLARALAEGTEIPYGRPFARLLRDD